MQVIMAGLKKTERVSLAGKNFHVRELMTVPSVACCAILNGIEPGCIIQ